MLVLSYLSTFPFILQKENGRSGDADHRADHLTRGDLFFEHDDRRHDDEDGRQRHQRRSNTCLGMLYRVERQGHADKRAEYGAHSNPLHPLFVTGSHKNPLPPAHKGDQQDKSDKAEDGANLCGRHRIVIAHPLFTENQADCLSQCTPQRIKKSPERHIQLQPSSGYRDHDARHTHHNAEDAFRRKDLMQEKPSDNGCEHGREAHHQLRGTGSDDEIGSE